MSNSTQRMFLSSCRLTGWVCGTSTSSADVKSARLKLGGSPRTSFDFGGVSGPEPRPWQRWLCDHRLSPKSPHQSRFYTLRHHASLGPTSAAGRSYLRTSRHRWQSPVSVEKCCWHYRYCALVLFERIKMSWSKRQDAGSVARSSLWKYDKSAASAQYSAELG